MEGDGTLVNIFKDSWLPGNNSSRVLSPISVLLEDAMMDQLIDSDSRWWNTSLVDSIFLPLKEQLIKSIPVCHFAQEDFYIGLIPKLECIMFVRVITCYVI